MLADLAKDDKEAYAQFWTRFGQVLKEGTCEDPGNRERIAKLLRFASTHNDSAVQDVSLDDYVSRMTEGQKQIYSVGADTYEAAANRPHLDVLRHNGIDVD